MYKVEDKVIFTNRPALRGIVKEVKSEVLVVVQWFDDGSQKPHKFTADVNVNDITKV